jgi:hypothetical protein
MIAKRYEKLYGATVEKRAKISVDLRYNANHNPMAIWHDLPITVDDVIKSRIVADPLHLLECVMPCAGACAFIVTRADIARGMRHKPAYVLGGANGVSRGNLTHVGEITISPVGRAARKAFAMAGYGPSDVQVMEIYDSFTITVMCELEESGFCPTGTAGDWVQARASSDIDLLVVAEGWPHSLADRRRPLLAEWARLRAGRELPEIEWNLVTKTPEEAQHRSPLYLDMVEDAVFLLDRGGFFGAVLEELRARMRTLGSRRVFLSDGSWYWDLKPDFRFGEVVEL